MCQSNARRDQRIPSAGSSACALAFAVLVCPCAVTETCGLLEVYRRTDSEGEVELSSAEVPLYVLKEPQSFIFLLQEDLTFICSIQSEVCVHACVGHSVLIDTAAEGRSCRFHLMLVFKFNAALFSTPEPYIAGQKVLPQATCYCNQITVSLSHIHTNTHTLSSV